MTSLLLSSDELHALTGYRMAARQLKALHQAGFHRARKGPTGAVILERAHYEAICAGVQQAKRPKVIPPVLNERGGRI
ncbi:MAG: hypothetical protein DI563_02465 [Variovorax paradoxus]|uniref:DUF4224 domain-containing protein n=1 Tax=Variovorax paradoxus TaxID=34073 RepID=A0A2W5QS24_VARPD|nr:MAG: hypothetical protein DI563_02465 [Variovorax paradoxus]